MLRCLAGFRNYYRYRITDDQAFPLLSPFPPLSFPHIVTEISVSSGALCYINVCLKKIPNHKKTKPYTEVCFSDSPFEKKVLLQMALRQCTSIVHCQVSSEHCPDGQLEGKGTCDQVPQAITDPHSPKIPFSPLQWEVSCYILCCQYLFCQSRTLCLVVQGLEGPKCAMSLSLKVSALCE